MQSVDPLPNSGDGDERVLARADDSGCEIARLVGELEISRKLLVIYGEAIVY